MQIVWLSDKVVYVRTGFAFGNTGRIRPLLSRSKIRTIRIRIEKE